MPSSSLPSPCPYCSSPPSPSRPAPLRHEPLSAVQLRPSSRRRPADRAAATRDFSISGGCFLEPRTWAWAPGQGSDSSSWWLARAEPRESLPCHHPNNLLTG